MAAEGARGVVTPYEEIVVREILGRPVVTRYRPWTPLDAHRAWGRFGDIHGYGPRNDIDATGHCCCNGCVGMGPCDLDLGFGREEGWDG